MSTERKPIELAHSANALDDLRASARASFSSLASGLNLRRAAPELIRAGTAGGLPFDVFTTDVVSGCLPASQICFGNCFAARSAYEAGIDFGKRVANILDEAILAEDLARLPTEQGYVCNGWNSDPSWNWPKVTRIAELIAAARKHPILISKIFVYPTDAELEALAAAGAEIRICISAFDSDRQVDQRIEAMEHYRSAGGLAVAIVMTTMFKDQSLLDRQDSLVEQLEKRDIPASENSLRIDPSTPVIAAIDQEACRHVPGSPGEIWAGRLYPERVPVPARFCSPFTYSGGIDPFASKNDRAFLHSLNAEPIPTHEQVLAMTGIQKPRSAGIAKMHRSE